MVNVGIIGMGIRGTLFAKALKDNPKCRVAAVCDLKPDVLAESVKNFNAKGFAGYKEMMDSGEIDALLITTPDYLHKDPVIYAAKKGLHVLVEKPFATSVEDCIMMRYAIKKSGIKCLVAFENRWNPPFVSLKEAVDRGELGRIIAINGRLNDTIFVPVKLLPWLKNSTPAWFLLSHLCDMSTWVKNEVPIRVYAVGVKEKLVSMGIDTYDSIQTIVTYRDNTSVCFTSSWILPECMPTIFDVKYEVVGTAGYMQIDAIAPVTLKGTGTFSNLAGLSSEIHGKMTGGPVLMVNSFIDNIVDDTIPLANEDDGFINSKTIAAVHRSISTGKVEEV